jgi:hypothetical protein
MMLGQSFTPKINMSILDSEGNSIRNIQLQNTVDDAWLHNAISTSPETLLFIGKRGGPWLARIQDDGRVLSEHIENENIAQSEAFTAIATRDQQGFIITHGGHVSVFDRQLNVQSTAAIQDITARSYRNPQLARDLPENLMVNKIIGLSTTHYLLFYQYGSRLVEINLQNNKR